MASFFEIYASYVPTWKVMRVKSIMKNKRDTIPCTDDISDFIATVKCKGNDVFRVNCDNINTEDPDKILVFVIKGGYLHDIMKRLVSYISIYKNACPELHVACLYPHNFDNQIDDAEYTAKDVFSDGGYYSLQRNSEEFEYFYIL